MQKTSDLPILIIGAGVGGLALSRALRHADVPFRLLERRSSTADGGLALNLPGNAMAGLAELGLAERMQTTGRPVRRREYRTAGDRLLFAVDEDDFWAEPMRPRCVRRSDLLSLLAGEVDDGCLRFGAEVGGFDMMPDRVNATVKGAGTMEGRLLVGADGVRSSTRTRLFGEGQGRSHAILAESSWRFTAPNFGIDCWTVWAGPKVMVLLLPMDDQEVYGWAAVSGKITEDPLDVLIGEILTFPSRVREVVLNALSTPGRLVHSPLEEVRLPKWHKGRAVLIGDAAHATAPVWAEGAALAIEDALVLSRCIAANGDIEQALTFFEARRRPRVTHVQEHTDAMSRAARLPGIVRNALLPFVGSRRYKQVYGPLKLPA